MKVRSLATIVVIVGAMACALQAATLTVGDVAMQPDTTATVVVSGDIADELAYGVTIQLEIVPQGGATGTVTFTPAPLPADVDIAQLGDPWPGVGTFTALDTNTSGSLLLNGSVDDNGTFTAASITFSGDLASFPVVASVDADGVWDVLLSTSAGDSTWEELTTTLVAGTITVYQGECFVDLDCDDAIACTDDTCPAGSCVYTANDANCADDGLYCTGAEVCDAALDCVSTGDPCSVDLTCDEATDSCVECQVDGDCDDGVACTDDTCPSGTCVFTANDANCADDGLYCTGAEVCDAALDCVSTGDPCQPGDVCDETNDLCTGCLTDPDCDDADVCTDDVCNAGTCEYTNNTASCDDGLFCTATDVCDLGTCVGTGDACPAQICDETGDVCLDASALLVAESLILDPDATADLEISGQIVGLDTYGVTLFVELVPRTGNTGAVTFTEAPPSDIAQLDDPWPGLGTFSPFDTDATGSVMLNGSSDDKGTLVPGSVLFSGGLAAFPVVASFDAGGVWDVVLATSVGDSSWEGVATTLTAGTITITPPVSLTVNSLAMPPDATAELPVSGTVQGLSTYGLSLQVQIVPRAGAVGTLEFTPAPPSDITQVSDPWPGAGTFTIFDTDISSSPLLNGNVDDNGSYISAPLTFSGVLSAFPVVSSVDADGVWDVTLDTTEGVSTWEDLTTVLFHGTITVTAGACVLDTDCDDGNSCTDDLCNAGVCEYAAVVGACDDGDPCTFGEFCAGLVCQGGIPVSCSLVGDQCNVGSCDPLGADGNCDIITPAVDGTFCNDGAICDVGETCQGGFCQGSSPVDCVGADDECNTASCDPAGLLEGNCDIFTPVLDGTPCVGTDVCTIAESCLLGVCFGGSPVNCTADGDQCNVASCDAAGAEGNCDTWTPVMDGTPCSDLDVCNIGETCQVGACLGGGPKDCTGVGTQCETVSCDPVGLEGNCATVVDLPDGTGCDDGLFCTVTDECGSGVCIGLVDPCPGSVCDDLTDSCVECLANTDCDDGNGCTNDTCSARTCYYSDNVLPCDDGDVCTLGDVCFAGACQSGAPTNCAGLGGACNTASCDLAGAEGNCDTLTPVPNGTVCSDGALCTVNDACFAGICTGAPKNCSAFEDDCNVGMCHTNTGICYSVSTNEGGACDDGFACTSSDFCTGGICEGSLVGAKSIDLAWSPVSQVVQVGQSVYVDLVASSGSCVDLAVASIDVVIQWDPAVLFFFGFSATGPFPLSSTSFPNDYALDGLNAPFTGFPANDGDALFHVFADFQTGVSVSASPGIVIATLEFVALDGSNGSTLDIAASGGVFSQTRVLGAAESLGLDLTGNLGSSFTEVDECQFGLDCDDGNVCTTDTCNSGVCEYANNSLTCDDGVFCTDVDVCVNGACVPGVNPCAFPWFCSEPLGACVECMSGLNCGDGNLCTDDVCDANGMCLNPPNTRPCNDGLFCTAVDMCTGGACVGGLDACMTSVCDEANDGCVECLIDADCDDGNPCTDDVCSLNTCQHPPNTLPCDDGFFCTVGDTCGGGVCSGASRDCAPYHCAEVVDACVPCVVDAHCDDGNPCTTEFCNIAFSCQYFDNVLPCDDGLFCTSGDTCSGGACLGTVDPCPGELCDDATDACVECFTLADCVDDGHACTDDACVDGVCTYTPIDVMCDDGVFCNGAEYCSVAVGCVTPGNPCDGPSLCDEITDACGCQEPAVVAEGSRYLAVTPASGQTPVALRVGGVDAEVSCLSLYVQPDGSLGSTPQFMPPSGPSGWSTVHVHGLEIRPSTTYVVRSECETGQGLGQSTLSSATSWRWADTNNTGGLVDIVDLTLIVDGFRGIFIGATLYNVDLWGGSPGAAAPQQEVDILDLTQALDAFRGYMFPAAAPCP